MDRPPAEHRLRELSGFFLRLGVTAFGGPAAHIAMMEHEAVRKRQWLSHEAFLDLLGAVNLIPGPSSTQMAMNIGYQRAGWLGLIMGGVCFILPASIITLGIAWAYVRFGRLPQIQGLFYGIKPIVVAIVFQALWNLGKTAFRTRLLRIMGLGTLFLSALGLHPLFVLFGAGAASLAFFWIKQPPSPAAPAMKGGWLPLYVGAGSLPMAGLTGLFLFFLKLGAVLFGSGYVLLAFLKTDLVDRWHWLSEAQLLDAVAVGQFTPGPVFTTATFIGYVLRGFPGAAVATIGIFLPSFLFVGILGVVLPRLRKSSGTSAFLDGINVGAVALMAYVTWGLSRAALVDSGTCLMALAAGFLLLRFKVNPTWMILAGGVTGFLLSGAHP